MASIHRRPASKFWHAFFRDSEGRLIEHQTTLEVSRGLAMLVSRSLPEFQKLLISNLFAESFGAISQSPGSLKRRPCASRGE